jgi:hypothetical protein
MFCGYLCLSVVVVTVAYVPEFASSLFRVHGKRKKKLSVASYHYYLRRRMLITILY